MNINKQIWILALSIQSIMLSSCEHHMTTETVVHEDGTLDKMISFEETDSSLTTQNIFGISSAHGWSLNAERLPQEKDDNKPKFGIRFSKHFNTVEEMNAELNNETDSLFKIKSSFEKKFRWFYTYIKYTETYMPINRFKIFPATDYLNQEDFQFIARLPNEEDSISKVDNMYLQDLNKKICESYTGIAMFNDWYDLILTKIVEKNNTDKKWMDTLKVKRNFIYEMLNAEWVFNGKKEQQSIFYEDGDKLKVDPNIVIKIADTLGISLQPREKTIQNIKEFSRDFNSRLNFMNFSKDGKFKNIIEMPWNVVTSNADSVSGNRLFWEPRVTKFLVTEYTMYAESRKLNIWAVISSGTFLLLTLYVWVRRKTK